MFIFRFQHLDGLNAPSEDLFGTNVKQEPPSDDEYQSDDGFGYDGFQDPFDEEDGYGQSKFQSNSTKREEKGTC